MKGYIVKLFCLFLTLSTLTAQANPMLTMKDRLRLHLWTEGLDQSPVQKNIPKQRKPLSEELERALRKL